LYAWLLLSPRGFKALESCAFRQEMVLCLICYQGKVPNTWRVETKLWKSLQSLQRIILDPLGVKTSFKGLHQISVMYWNTSRSSHVTAGPLITCAGRADSLQACHYEV
jgi:hypothetical protein